MEEPVDTLGGVMREVAATQRAALAQRNLLAQVRRRPPLRRSAWGRWPRLRVALPALAVVGAVALWFGRTTVRDRWDALNQSPLTFSVGDGAAFTGKAGDRLQATADAAVTLHFSDGSQVTLQRGARVQVAELDRRGAQLRLESGRAEVSVHHRRDTRWQLRAGAFAVTVTGTKFSMDWEDAREALTVVMTEGAVEIRGPGVGNQSPVVVSAGQRFSGSAREARWSLGAEAAQAPQAMPVMPAPTEAPAAVPTDRAPRPTSPISGGTPRAPAVPSNWQALARAGRYPEAVKVVERAGFERACQRLGAEDLLQLGDAARLARNPERAETAYRAARKRFPASDRPAFALGLVAFEQRHDFKAAAHWFELYARTYPEGPLAREAVGREMESWQRAGDAARARRAARDYLDQAPTGPYAPLARQLSGR